MSEGRERRGLTAVAALAIAYTAIALTPAAIYMSLVTGAGAAGFAFITLLLFSEVGRHVGRYITPQEACIIYYMSGVVGGEALYWLSLLQNLYFREAPYTVLFGIAKEIPTWAAPPLDSWAVRARALIAPEWALPIAVTLLGTLASVLVDIGLSFILIQLYVVEERLPFPMASVSAVAISTIAERKYGPEAWGEKRVAVVAGASLGAGLALTLSAPLVMIARSVWQLPF